MLRQIARAVVLRYPQPWLDRYGDEVLELVDDSPVRMSDIGELLRGVIVERMKALIEPGDAPRAAFVVLGSAAMLVRVAPSVLVIGGAVALGLGARQWAGSPPEYVFDTGVLVLAAVISIHFWRKWTMRATLPWAVPAYQRFSPRMRVLMISAMFVSMFLVYWAGWGLTGTHWPPVLSRWPQLLIFIVFVDKLTSGFWPWRPMFDAMDAYSDAVRELRKGQREVDRVRAYVASGMELSQELANAEIARDRLARQRDAAAAILHRYGYRARFRDVA